MIYAGQKPLLSVTLPVKLTNGNGGRSQKWFLTAKDRDAFEALLRSLGHVYSPIPFPVQLVVTRLLGKRERFWDYSSGFRGNWKELEDAMVACGWFKDDGPDDVKGVFFDQQKHAGDSAVKVEIFAIE